VVTSEDRGRFLLDYIDLLCAERIREPEGFRHTASGPAFTSNAAQSSHDRWVINKIRALGAWFTKGHECGSNLRSAINHAQSLSELRELISRFFFTPAQVA
jgi:hypothetical protein